MDKPVIAIKDTIMTKKKQTKKKEEQGNVAPFDPKLNLTTRLLRTGDVKDVEEEEPNLEIDISDDLSYLDDISSNWEDIRSLHDTQIKAIQDLGLGYLTTLANPAFGEALEDSDPDSKNRFKVLTDHLVHDLGEYKERLTALEDMYKGKEGKVESLEDLETYNRLQVEYFNLTADLTSVINPSVTSFIMFTSELMGEELFKTEEELQTELMEGASLDFTEGAE